MKTRNSDEVLKEIEKLQAIQKTHRPTDSAWMATSELLAPLFSEMAILQKKQSCAF